MGFWSFYFLLKLALYWAGIIGFHWWQNLVLALFVLLPMRRASRVLQQLIAIPAGILLLYYDSYLPPFERVYVQLHDLSQFRFNYLIELLGRFVHLQDIGLLVAAFLVYWLLACKLRMTAFALLGILLVPLLPLIATLGMMSAVSSQAVETTAPKSQPELTPAEELSAFFRSEHDRQVSIPAPSLDDVPFDIVIIHICSLAWDDLDLFKLADHPFLKHANISFQNFNSAASYSGPAALRVLHMTCGQLPQHALYQPGRPRCLLFNQLTAIGYQPQLMLNHSGKFGNFLGAVQQLGGFNAPLRPVGNARQTQREFDGEPIYSDHDLLTQWLADRAHDPAQRVVLYYNTVSLHDGNTLLSDPGAPSSDTYARRARQLLDTMSTFIKDLNAAKRRTMVIFVPEHGANMRGDALQIPGLREIPTPQITLIPVAIYLTGGNKNLDAQLKDSDPTSFLAISTLISRLMRNDPFNEHAPPLQHYARNLPQTHFVAQNSDDVIMRYGNEFMRRDPQGSWAALTTGIGRGAAELGRPPVPVSAAAPTATH